MRKIKEESTEEKEEEEESSSSQTLTKEQIRQSYQDRIDELKIKVDAIDNQQDDDVFYANLPQRIIAIEEAITANQQYIKNFNEWSKKVTEQLKKQK